MKSSEEEEAVEKRDNVPGPKEDIAWNLNWMRLGGIEDLCNVGFPMIKHKKKNFKWGRVDLSMLYRRLNLEISIEFIHPGDRVQRRNNCLSRRSKKDCNGGIIIY